MYIRSGQVHCKGGLGLIPMDQAWHHNYKRIAACKGYESGFSYKSQM